jgi:hypothetical protein
LLQEQKVSELKKHRQQQLQREAVEANQSNRVFVEQRREQERLEELAIIEYSRNLAKQERERLVEERGRKDAKEKEMTRLRDLQEKHADLQSEIDAIRAKRAFEQHEREARRKERLEYEKRQRQQAEMEAARALQFQDR